KLAALFDENLAKKAWAARIEHRDEIAIPLFQEACNELLTRVSMLPDHRSRVLISDALHWAQENPNEIHFHAYSPNMAIDVSPNVVGFQSVMSGIARRIRQRGGKAKEIVVDQQSQFNQAQKRLAKWYADARTVQGIVNGPGLPRLDFRDMPSIQLLIKDSKASPGLSLVDIYLWIHRRFLEGKPLAPELHHIISINAARTTTDEMSLNAIDRRWSRWFDQLPDPSPEAVAKAAELHREEEEHRLKAVRTLS
ncbi:MAG: hypothetical protein Q8L65_15040, partial [Burkholderiales bacterium]|nr:hypothetical protein [Burkholderiales bacterium]